RGRGGAWRSRARGLVAPLQLSCAHTRPVSHVVRNADESCRQLSHRRRRLSATGDLWLHGPSPARPWTRGAVPVRSTIAHQETRAARPAREREALRRDRRLGRTPHGAAFGQRCPMTLALLALGVFVQA